MTALLLSTFLATLAVSSVNILLPELMTHLDASYSSVQWVVVGYMAALSAALVIAGRLSDMYGGRRLFIVGIVVFTSGAMLCGLATSADMLASFRILQGIGAAILIAVNLALVSDLVSGARRGAAIGLVGSMSAIGTASGPVIGGWLAEAAGWQWVFFINAPIGLLVLVIGVLFLPQTNPPATRGHRRFDFAGASLLALSTVCYAVGLRLFGSGSPALSACLLAASAIALFAFVRTEFRSSDPLVRLTALKDQVLTVAIGLNFVVAAAVMTALIIGPFYLMAGLGLTLAETGLVMAVSPMTVAVTSFVAGRRLNTDNTRAQISFGLVFLLLGSIALACLDRTLLVYGYIGCLMTTAVGYGTFTASNNTFVMNRAAATERGAISGLLNLSRNAGLLSGAALMSALFELFTGASHYDTLGPEVTEDGLNIVYACVAALLCLAIAGWRVFARSQRWIQRSEDVPGMGFKASVDDDNCP